MQCARQGNDQLVQFDLMPTFARLLQRRVTIFLYALAGLVLGVVLAAIYPPWYAGRAVFLPPKQADLLTTSSGMSLFANSESGDLYIGLLGSRTVADDVIDRAHLMQEYNVTQREDARARLGAASAFEVDKNTLISITVRAKRPALAADIANAYLDALYRLNGQMAASGSIFRTSFFEQQLDEQRKALAAADLDLKNTQVRTGVVLPAGEAQANISATAQLQTQITLEQSRLAALRASETEENPEVARVRRSLGILQAELAARQSSSGARGSQGLPSNNKLPQLALENEEKAREVKLRQEGYEALVAQYEKARLSASDPGPQFQIVDRAVVPERKAGPPRRLFVIGGLTLGAMLGLLVVSLSSPARRLYEGVRRRTPVAA
jgi:tyrosine-protein kinase Etk/Wzc